MLGGDGVRAPEITNSGWLYNYSSPRKASIFHINNCLDALEAFLETDDGAALNAIFSQAVYDFQGGNGPDKMEGGAFGDKFNGAGGDDTRCGAMAVPTPSSRTAWAMRLSPIF